LALSAALPAVLLAAGCAHYQPKPLVPEKTAAEFVSRTLADAGLRAFIETNLHTVLPAWPPASWDFTHLTLAALYFHPDLDVARARWAVARAGTKTAAQRPNPTLSVTPGYNTTTAVPSPWLVTPTLDIPIETAGKRGYRIAEATQLSEAARLDIASAAWHVRSRLRRAWIEVYVAQETHALLRRQHATLEQVVKLLEAQLAAGAVSPVEVAQTRVLLDRNRLDLHDAERRHAEARAGLAAAIGIPAAASDTVVLSFAGLTEVPVELPTAEARRQTLLHRADIRGERAQGRAADTRAPGAGAAATRGGGGLRPHASPGAPHRDHARQGAEGRRGVRGTEDP
jgi:outer membrane protein TolC